jgi:ferredoxin
MYYSVVRPPSLGSVTEVYRIRRFRIMAYKITDACVACGTCAEECPVEAIHEGDGKYEINADTCIECGTCADACPTGAIEAP